MKLRFRAVNTAPSYTIINEIINGIDLSVIEEGGTFLGNSNTKQAGIYDAYREGGELYVTLKQATVASQHPPHKAHWRAGGWIDAADYDASTCYVVPTGVSGSDDYEIAWSAGSAPGEQGWTIVAKETDDA